jgi:hypothetical protein
VRGALRGSTSAAFGSTQTPQEFGGHPTHFRFNMVSPEFRSCHPTPCRAGQGNGYGWRVDFFSPFWVVCVAGFALTWPNPLSHSLFEPRGRLRIPHRRAALPATRVSRVE